MAFDEFGNFLPDFSGGPSDFVNLPPDMMPTDTALPDLTTGTSLVGTPGAPVGPGLPNTNPSLGGIPSWLQSLLGIGLGAAGPIAGLIGGIAAGGKTGTQQQTGQQTGTQQGQMAGQQFGQQFGLNQPQWGFPEQAAAFGGAQGMQNFMSPMQQALYGGGGNLLAQMAGGQNPLQLAQSGLLGALGQNALGLIGNPVAASNPGANPAFQMAAGNQGLMNSIAASMGGQGAAMPGPMGMLPTDDLTAYRNNLMAGNLQIPPALQGLIQKSFDPMVGQLTEQAIQNARSRGFAGGADLLGGAASNVAGQALQNVPGQEAQALLNALLVQIPGAASQLKGAETAAGGVNVGAQQANIAAAKAANDFMLQQQANQLGLGGLQNQLTLGLGGLANQMRSNEIQAALADAQRLATGLGVAGGFNQPAGLIASMLPQMMGQGQQGFANQMSMFAGFPFGAQNIGQNLGQQAQQNIGQTTGQQTGQQQQALPIGQVIGQGLGNMFSGAAQGLNAFQNYQNQQQMNQAMMNLLNTYSQRGSQGG